MCDAWRYSFEAFSSDMGEKPEGYTLERIDNEGNYEPGNCRWATPSEQATNQERNPKIAWGGLEMRIVEWAKHLGVSGHALRTRKHKGWSIDRMFTQPYRRSPSKSRHTVM